MLSSIIPGCSSLHLCSLPSTLVCEWWGNWPKLQQSPAACAHTLLCVTNDPFQDSGCCYNTMKVSLSHSPLTVICAVFIEPLFPFPLSLPVCICIELAHLSVHTFLPNLWILSFTMDIYLSWKTCLRFVYIYTVNIIIIVRPLKQQGPSSHPEVEGSVGSQMT